METEFYDGRRRSKIVLLSDFECCHKYRNTLPDHVELVGSSDYRDSQQSDSSKSKILSSGGSSRTQSVASFKSAVGSDKSREDLIVPDVDDEIEVESDRELDVETVEEEEEYESSICSEWIVLKPEKKRRKKKEIVEESSASDLNEPATGKRLLKRPPSPEGEVYDEKSKPENLTPSNFFKYKDLQQWPEPSPMDQALLKREPSPNMSLPKSRDELELAGEDWLWFEGRYMESGELEIHGEGGLYYRLPTQWKEGHWEPAPALLEKWEKEEQDVERERQRALEEKQKYEAILKREDSPGMDVINWGDGPVKMPAHEWPKSLTSLSELLPKSVSDRVLQIASEVPPEVLKELMAKLEDAMMAENSVEMIQLTLDAYISKGLDMVDTQKQKETLLVQDSVVVAQPTMSLRDDFKALSSKSVRFFERASPQSNGEAEEVDVEGELMPEEEFIGEAEEEETPITKPKNARDDPCDVIPDTFRDTLLEFIQDFVADKPGDPLIYAIGYFQSRIPKDVDQSIPGESAHSEIRSRRLAAFHRSTDQSEKSINEGEPEEHPKTAKEVEILVRALNSCWVTKDLDLSTTIALVKAMFQIEVNESDELQSAEEEPNAFYVIRKGSFQLRNEFGVKIMNRGYFGELSLNSMVSESLKARFSVTALTRGAVWCLRRADYHRIKDAFKTNKKTILFSMFGVLDLFGHLTEEEKETVVDCLDLRYYKRKEIIFCQGSYPEGIYFFLDGVFKLINIELPQGSLASSGRASLRASVDSVTTKKTYHARTYQAPRLLGYGNFTESRPWGYSCVARSNVVQVAILKTDVFERLMGDPEDVMNRPPPPPPRPKPSVKKETGDEVYGEAFGEYLGEYRSEEILGEAAPPPPPPPPKVIPWLKKKVEADPDEPPKPKAPPTYEEIMAAMWGTTPVYQHPKDAACLCGRCKDAVTCVGQGIACCGKPKIPPLPKK